MRGSFWRILLTIGIVVTGCGGKDGEQDEAAGRASGATTAPTAAVVLTASSIPTGTAVPAETSFPIIPTTPAPTATPTVMIISEAERQPPTPPAGPLSGEQLVSALRSGGYVIYFRHAATDPLPDDANPIILSDCKTQRNLSAEGRAQASAIGQAIERLEIPIGSVLSSPFCRALETAQLAFGKATIEAALENLETAESEAERETRIEVLQRLLAAPPEGAANSVLVGHGFNINAAAGLTIAEGEAAIFRPEGESGFTLVATIKPGKWEELMTRLYLQGPFALELPAHRANTPQWLWGESPLSAAPKQDGSPSCFPKETIQRHRHDKVYSQSAGLEAVQSHGDGHCRSPALHRGRRSN